MVENFINHWPGFVAPLLVLGGALLASILWVKLTDRK